MDRLTFDGNFCDICRCEGEYRMTSECADGPCSQRKVWEKLKEYEDTGMTPEQIQAAQETLRCFDNIGIKRGNEIVKAEQEGRLVVLPCRAGETWRDGRGEAVVIDGYHYDIWAGWSILYHYADGDGCSCNRVYFEAHFTKEG